MRLPHFRPKSRAYYFALGVGVVVDSKQLAERGTPEFYREQAARLTAIAVHAISPAVRLELLEMAAVFQKLAVHVAANRTLDGYTLPERSA